VISAMDELNSRKKQSKAEQQKEHQYKKKKR
jgi:hypothetical protein